MNERIKLLAHQAREYGMQHESGYRGYEPKSFMDYYTEKLAELIIQECIEEIENQYGGGRELEDGSHSLDWDQAIECVAAFVRTNFGIAK